MRRAAIHPSGPITKGQPRPASRYFHFPYSGDSADSPVTQNVPFVKGSVGPISSNVSADHSRLKWMPEDGREVREKLGPGGDCCPAETGKIK